MSTTVIEDQIRMYAKLLKIPTFTTYKEALRQLSPDSDISEILLSLMKTEYEQRQENQNLRRLKRAGFPFTKTLEELDLSRYSGSINEIFINELAIGLGLKACSMGMSVLFKNAYSLSTELSEARDNYSLGKLEKRIQKADLLILDEMGYVSFDRYQSELLFKIIADRSERGSIIVTTNLPFSEWTTLFENTAMVAAMIDRLTFQSYVLDMNGESYRLAKTKEARK